MSEVINTITDFNTQVSIRVVDKNGNTTAHIEDKNAETLWAKLNTPVSGTLSLDFITIDTTQVYGVPLASLIKTSHTELATLRSNVLSAAFTLTGNVYTLSFNWYNNTGNTIVINGLLSYTTANTVYTVFDMTNNPVSVVAGSTVIGTYKITYDAATPTVLANTAVSSTLNVNRVYSGLRENLSDNLRAYKLSRVFIKTSVYIGSNILDTSFTSSLNIAISSSNFATNNFYNSYTGEIFYKCLVSGSPGGATVSRFAILPLVESFINVNDGSTVLQMQVNSNIPYIIDLTYNSTIVRNGVGGIDSVTWSPYKTITATNQTDINIYPYKIIYPTSSTNIEPYLTNYLLKWGLYGAGYSSNPTDTTLSWSATSCNAVSPFIGPSTETGTNNHYYLNWQHAQIFYWDNAPTLTVYALQPSTAAGVSYGTLSAYINGTLYTSATAVNVTLSGNSGGWIKYVFNLTGLASSGSGTFVLWKNYDAGTSLNNAPDPISTLFSTNMYSYMVPYGGMLTSTSSQITSGWISPSVMNVNGSDTVLTTPLWNASDVSSVQTVQGTSISAAMSSAIYQYGISVTRENAAKLAGIISKNNSGIVIRGYQVQTLGYANGGLIQCEYFGSIPYYVTANNYVHFGNAFYRYLGYTNAYGMLRPDVAWHVNPAYFQALYNTTCNSSITVDYANNVVQYNDAKSFFYLSTAQDLSDSKLHIFRQQGAGNYTYQIPEVISPYVQGTPTVSWSSNTYEFETVLMASEAINNMSINIQSNSIFATNEYFSFPFCNKNTLLIDTLETWNISAISNIPNDMFSDTITNKYVGADSLIDQYNTSITTTYPLCVNTGELIPYKVQLPLSTMQVEGNSDYTQVLTFEVTWNADTTQYPAIHIPKVLTRSGIQLLTNVQSVYVTDGIHVIPWSLNPDYVQQPKLIRDNSKYSWELALNRVVIDQLYPINTTLIVYAYVQAKPKSSWLPYAIDIRNIYNTNYSDNNGINTLLLLHSNTYEGDITVTNSSTVSSNLSLVTSGSNLYNTLVQGMFGLSSYCFSNSTAYIQVANGHGVGGLKVGTSMTLDFWINPSDLSSNKTLISCYNSTTYYLTSQYGWYISLITSSGTAYLQLSVLDVTVSNAATSTWTYGANDGSTSYITTNTWHHIALVVNEGFLKIFADGICRGVCQFAVETAMNSLTFGASSSGFAGYMAEMHLTKGALWMDEFVPPAYPWGSSNLTIQYRPTAVLPVELPIALDPNIDVINVSDSSEVTFLLADSINGQLTSGYSNKLYLSISTIKYTQSDDTNISYLELPIRSRGSYYLDGGMSGAYFGLSCCYDKGNRGLAHSLVGINPHRTTNIMTTGNVYGYLISGKYQQLGYKFKDTISIPDKNTTVVEIISSSTPKSTTPANIFSSVYKAAQLPNYLTATIGTTPVLIDVEHYKCPMGGSVGSYDPAVVFASLLPVKNLSNTITDVRAATPGFRLYSNLYYGMDYNTTYHYTFSTNPTTQSYKAQFAGYPLNNSVLNYDNKLSTSHFIQSTSSAYTFVHNSYLSSNVNYGRLYGPLVNPTYYSSIVQYQKAATLFTTNMLDLYYQEPGLLTPSYVDAVSGSKITGLEADGYTVLNGNLINVTDLSATPTTFLYTTNKTINPGDTTVFSIDNTAITNTSSFDIVTYVPSSYTYLNQPYVNTSGIHLLSTTANTISYEVLFSNRFMNNNYSAYKFGFTTNSELISILNSNNVIMPYTIGYVSDSYNTSDTLAAGTVYSGYQTNTIVIEAPIFGSRQIALGALTGLERHQITAYKDVYHNLKTTTSSYFMDNIRCLSYVLNNYQTHTWPNAAITSTAGWTGLSFTQYPYFNNYNLDELYLNTSFGCAAWNITTTPGTIGDTAAPIQVSLNTVGTQTYKTGITANDAIYIDSRVIAKTNTKINVIFDSKNIPVQSVSRLGKISIQTYTNEYGASTITYIPIVKIVNNTTSSYSIYALNDVYGNPVDMTNTINNLTLSNINALFINNVKINNFTYEGFNSLLSIYNGSNYTMNLGFIIYNTVTNSLCIFKGLSIEIEFLDTSLYTRPEWCYMNKVSGLMGTTKASLTGNTTNNTIQVYNPNNVALSQYAIRLDVSDYNLAGFTTGIVAELVSLQKIPTLYETGTDGHVTNVLGSFNGQGLWVLIPYIGANSTITLQLVNYTNSYVSTDVFAFYEGFNSLDSINLTYSKLDGTSMTASVYSTTPPGTVWGEVVMAVCHNVSIGVSNNTLILNGQESTSVISNAASLLNTNRYEVRYAAADTSNLEIAFGTLSNISYVTSLPYYNETTDTNYTFIQTDLHNGDNYFYVYYGGAAPTLSTTNIFNIYQDFSNTSVPGWFKYNSGTMTISSGSMNVTNINSRLLSANSFSPKQSWGAIVRLSSSSINNNAIICSMAVSDHAFSGFSTGLNSTIRYIGEMYDSNTGIGAPIPTTTPATYIFTDHQNNMVSAEKFTTQISAGKYYVTENDFGRMLRHGGGTETYFNLGGSWSSVSGFNASGAVNMTYTLAAVYKAPKALHYAHTYSTAQTGSWTIGSYTYTNRVMVKVQATATDTQCVIKFDRTNFANNTALAITSTTALEQFSRNTNAITFRLGTKKQNITGMASGATVDIPYWMTSSDTENAFINCPNISKGSNILYVYYTSVTSTANSNGYNVFNFYEDFASGTLNTAKWNVGTNSGSGYSVSANNYTVTTTPAHIRSHYLLHGWYSVMVRGSITGTVNANSIFGIWNNYVDFYGDTVYTNSKPTGFTIGQNTALGLGNVYSNSPSTPFTVVAHNNEFEADKRTSLTIYGASARMDAADGTYAAAGTGWASGRNPFMLGRQTGNIRIGTSPHYYNTVGTTISTTCNWVAAWQRSKSQLNCIWGAEQSGSWVVNGFTFTNRKQLTIVSDDSDTNVVIRIKQAQFNNSATIRIQQVVKNGYAMRYVDTHKTDTVFSFFPMTNNVSYIRTLLSDPYGMSDTQTGLPLTAPTTGSIGITASTGSDTNKVIVRWIRSRAYAPLEPVQLRSEDLVLLIQNMRSDWYYIDTTVSNVHAANVTAITTLIASNAALNHDAVFLQSYKAFPTSDLIKNGCYGFGRLLSYRN